MRIDPIVWWKGEFGDIPPVGFILRQYFESHWTRFHSLPESKRYPDSETEYAELLLRHSQVADVLFTESESVFLFRSSLNEQLEGTEMGSIQSPGSSVPAFFPHDEDEHVLVRAEVTEWKPTFFDNLVRNVADEIERHIAFVSPKTRNIYAPYDGGLDVFSFSTSLAALKIRFGAWRSPRADQL